MRNFIVLTIFLFVQVYAFAQTEKITEYHVDLKVQEDRSLEVTEKIVYTPGNLRKRGITRGLPNKRVLKDKTMSMKYDILSVTKDGQEEPYHTQGEGSEKMLYVGQKEIFLKPGIYTYVIKYVVPNQIAFFEDYDEIYWNAIPHNIGFQVDTASVTVQMPKGIVMTQDDAYFGSYGSTDKSYTRGLQGGNFEYAITRPLKPREGFSVAMAFEKGFFEAPSLFQRYGSLMIVIMGLLFLIPYYIHTWMRYGQDPEAPASYPLWDAPDGLSPASINYVLHERTHKNAITASVIDLAIKGYIVIDETESGVIFKSKNYSLTKLKDGDDSLPQEQQRLMNSLFMSGDRVSIDGEYNSNIKASYDNHSSNLSAQHKAFVWEGNNLHFLWIPILITVLVAIAAIFILIKSPYAEWINMVTIVGFGVVALVMLFLYGYLIRQPTIDLLDLQSRIKGFKMYMELAEEDRINLLNPPGMTPEHFEAALPYAFALGVEHLWTKKFAKVFEASNYKPDYYRGNNMIYFGSHFGRDFSSSMAATSTPPPPAGGSGSGGGGFSGGGGGGGSVGSW